VIFILLGKEAVNLGISIAEPIASDLQGKSDSLRLATASPI
jgi:hypothetical protein